MPDGQRRRISVYRRADGFFGFFEECEYRRPLFNDETGDSDFILDWAGLPHHPSICDTAETAEREARSFFPWLSGTKS